MSYQNSRHPTRFAALIVLGFSSATHAQIAYVQSNYSSLGSGSSTSVALTTQSVGDLNVVVISWIDPSISLSSISDSAGNTYSSALGPTENVSGGGMQSIYYAQNIAAAGSNTLTVTMSGSVGCCLDVRVAEYSGMATSSVLDGAVGGAGTGLTMTSGSITTTNANDLLVGGSYVAGATTGPGTGYTQRLITDFSSILEDQIVSSVGSYAATAPQYDSNWYIMSLAAFKGAAAAGPSAPASPTATSVSSSQINLSWTAATGGVGGAAGYSVERCAGASCTSFAQIEAPSATSYNDSGLTASTSYSYRVRAIDTAGHYGAYSSVVTASTPSGAASISFIQSAYSSQTSASGATVVYGSAQTAGDLNVVTIGWIDSGSNAPSSVTDGKGNTYALAVGPTRYSTGGAEAIYYAANVAAASAAGNTVTVTMNGSVAYLEVQIAEYTGIAASSVLDGALGGTGTAIAMSSGSLTTTHAADLLIGDVYLGGAVSSQGTGYTLRVTADYGSILEDQIVSSTGSYAATATQYDGNWYIMQVAAFKGAAGGSPAPSAPTALAGTATSTSQISLTWSASSGGIGGVSSYSIERCLGASCTNFSPIGTSTTATFSDSGLAASTTYSYRVRAIDTASNDSAYSSVATATTQSGGSSSSSGGSSGSSSSGGGSSSGSSSSSSSGGSSGTSGGGTSGGSSFSGLATYHYDANRHLTSVTYGGGGSVSYDYDAAGNLTGQSTP